MRISENYRLTDQEYSDATDELKLEYIKIRVSNGWQLSDQQEEDAKRFGLI